MNIRKTRRLSAKEQVLLLSGMLLSPVFFRLITLRFLLEYFNRYFVGYPDERFTKELPEKLFEHPLQVTCTVYEEKGIGKYLLRFNGRLKPHRAACGQQNFWQNCSKKAEALHLAPEDKIGDPGANLTAGQGKILTKKRSLKQEYIPNITQLS